MRAEEAQCKLPPPSCLYPNDVLPLSRYVQIAFYVPDTVRRYRLSANAARWFLADVFEQHRALSAGMEHRQQRPQKHERVIREDCEKCPKAPVGADLGGASAVGLYSFIPLGGLDTQRTWSKSKWTAQRPGLISPRLERSFLCVRNQILVCNQLTLPTMD
jgi:hypothetical protein